MTPYTLLGDSSGLIVEGRRIESGMAPKRLEKRLERLELGGRIESIHTTALLRSAWIPRVAL